MIAALGAALMIAGAFGIFTALDRGGVPLALASAVGVMLGWTAVLLGILPH